VQRRHGGEGEDVDGGWEPSLPGQLCATGFERVDEQGDRMIGGEIQFARDSLPEGGLPSLVKIFRSP
jgi:hypothetical protein